MLVTLSKSFRQLSCVSAKSIVFGDKRAVFRGWRNFQRCSNLNKSEETALCRQLKAKIRSRGPLTVAKYMQEVLTNPVAGYYMHKDVFGTQGDFITSPEISQMFGELIGVWCVNEWMQCGSPSQIQVVELGPGRGTLSEDMLRVFSQFKQISDAVSLHLVEVSPKLGDMQEHRLTDNPGTDERLSPESANTKFYKKCLSKYGPEVRWYRDLRDVPRGFSFFLAHEFLDALPIHAFQRKNDKWREILVDVDDTEEGEHHLRFVLSRLPTAASQLLFKIAQDDPRDHIEICPEAGIVVEELTERISHNGGFALLADYGHTGEKSDSFRAFKSHKLHHPLCEPGLADLTADVDFSYLKHNTHGKVATAGPVSQANFLHNMGIGLRLQVLMGKASPEQKKNLISGYDMLTNPKKMGERFKFFALHQHSDQEYAPAGFVDLQK